MKALILSVLALVAVGCAGSPFSFGEAKNQIESLIAISAAGTYTVLVTKDDQTIFAESWICTQDAGKLTGCHKAESE